MLGTILHYWSSFLKIVVENEPKRLKKIACCFITVQSKSLTQSVIPEICLQLKALSICKPNMFGNRTLSLCLQHSQRRVELNKHMTWIYGFISKDFRPAFLHWIYYDSSSSFLCYVCFYEKHLNWSKFKPEQMNIFYTIL